MKLNNKKTLFKKGKLIIQYALYLINPEKLLVEMLLVNSSSELEHVYTIIKIDEITAEEINFMEGVKFVIPKESFKYIDEFSGSNDIYITLDEWEIPQDNIKECIIQYKDKQIKGILYPSLLPEIPEEVINGSGNPIIPNLSSSLFVGSNSELVVPNSTSIIIGNSTAGIYYRDFVVVFKVPISPSHATIISKAGISLLGRRPIHYWSDENNVWLSSYSKTGDYYLKSSKGDSESLRALNLYSKYYDNHNAPLLMEFQFPDINLTMADVRSYHFSINKDNEVELNTTSFGKLDDVIYDKAEHKAFFAKHRFIKIWPLVRGQKAQIYADRVLKIETPDYQILQACAVKRLNT